ncbi:hypothetical protein [Virgibacillus senegalensis]|uniref:hypothetical protein n=1 Tax=Virgibacillus senegalensis TaxID=1499679 RepID=UPI000B2D37D9|nr:hypothetical protein [Virgibacillus senegalensis]
MNKNSNYIIPAGLFIGLGIGMLIQNPAAGIFIGLGVGFLIRFVLAFFEDKSADPQ